MYYVKYYENYLSIECIMSSIMRIHAERRMGTCELCAPGA